MRTRQRIATALSAFALTIGIVATSANPAAAAPVDKPQVLSSGTQTSSSGYNAWLSARGNQAAWSAYAFNWSTDYYSTSPDNPFGYRDYTSMGTFDSNKSRLDSAFYADLLRMCDRYSGATGASCDATAWTYYQAVRAFG